MTNQQHHTSIKQNTSATAFPWECRCACGWWANTTTESGAKVAVAQHLRESNERNERNGR